MFYIYTYIILKVEILLSYTFLVMNYLLLSNALLKALLPIVIQTPERTRIVTVSFNFARTECEKLILLVNDFAALLPSRLN